MFDKIRINQYLWYKFVESDSEIFVLQLQKSMYKKYVQHLLFSEENENNVHLLPVGMLLSYYAG